MKILALESSACAASVAIAEDGKLLGEAFLNTGLTHSQTLLPLVHGLLKNANLALDEIDAFAVTNGPGSFTGVRIGVAAIKGLAFPHDKPCIPLSTLEVIAFGQTGGDCTVCAAMDARCAQVYTALFSCRAGALSRLTEDAAMKITELPPLLTGKNLPVVFAGDGAKLCMDAIGEQIPGSRIAPAYHYYQQAACAALLAEEKLLHGEGIPSDALAPFYLRLPQAERELRKNKIMNDWEDFYMIALGADHGGYQLKETIKKHLEERGIPYQDFGTNSTESVDYAPIAAEAARAVTSGACEKGILCCGTGIGISIAANKVKGIRAACCSNYFGAKYTRLHNDANMLCLGERVIGPGLALELVDVFLDTPFEGGRHQRRIDQITAIEQEEL